LVPADDAAATASILSLFPVSSWVFVNVEIVIGTFADALTST